ncbi:MAG: anti-sigma factor, partial [Candidatus Dormibacteraceae bacterium]
AVLVLVAWNVDLTRQISSAPGPGAVVTTHAIVQSNPGSWGDAKGQITLAGSVNVVSFSGLPPLPADQVYELWVGPSATTVRGAGVFRAEPDGTKTLVLNHGLSHDALIAVTIEPGPGGTRAPTEPPQMLGRL